MHASAFWVPVFITFGLVSIAGGGMLWGRRSDFLGGIALSLHLISLGLWTSAYGISLGVPANLAVDIRNVMQVCVLLLPVTEFVFAAHYTGRADHLRRGLVGFLVSGYVVTAVLAVVNFRGWFLPHGRSPIDGTITQPGPLYLLALTASTLQTVIASWWLVRFATTSRSLTRIPAAALVAGVAVAWTGSCLTALRVFPFGVDATTLALLGMSGCFLFAVLTDQHARLRRVWERAFVQGYGNGYLLIDGTGTVVLGNDAALSLLGFTVPQVKGASASRVFVRSPEIAALVGAGQQASAGPLPAADPRRQMMCDAYPLQVRAGQPPAMVLQLREVTERYVDPLTGAGNRRFFYERAGQVLSDCIERGIRCSVALVDLDHLKQINDAGGHSQGDAALQQLAGLLRQHLPDESVIGRVGGDEFAVAVAGTDAAGLAARIDAVRSALAGADPARSISGGVSEVPAADSLVYALSHADEALLRAKEEGRDRVLVQPSGEGATQ